MIYLAILSLASAFVLFSVIAAKPNRTEDERRTHRFISIGLCTCLGLAICFAAITLISSDQAEAEVDAFCGTGTKGRDFIDAARCAADRARSR